MNDRKAIFIAVLSSLLLHSTLFYVSAVFVSRHIWMSADELWADLPPVEQNVEVPDPPLPIVQPEMDELGEIDGTGNALDTIEFPQPQLTEQIGPEQAALSSAVPLQRRSSEGEPRSLGPTRKRQELRPTNPNKSAPSGDIPEVENGVDSPADETRATDSQQADGADSGKTDADHTETSPDQTSSPSSSEVESTGPDFNASDQDSDPFSAEQAYEFRPGGTRARGGRDIKMQRPRVDLQFRADATRLGTPLGILTEITIDKDSKPTGVVIIKSSGSQAIDDAVRLAIFRSTFGQPAPATFRFGVLFY